MIILRNFSKIEFPDQILVTSNKTKETVTLDKWKPNAFTKFLQKIWNLFGAHTENWTSFTISNKEGDHIGDIDIMHISNEELHIEWIVLKDNKQNLGYGKAILRSIIDFAIENGYKIISLEVPSGKSQEILGTSDSARYVYESLGFVTTGKVSKEGLIEMKLDLSRKQKTFSSEKENEKDKPSVKKQALISGGVGLTSGLGIGGLTYHTLNKSIDDKVKNHVKTEVDALNSGRERVKKFLGEEGIKELESRIAEKKSPEYAKEFKKGLKKVAKNKALRNGGVVAAVAGGLALSKTRGELDKDHLKASLDVDPFRAVGGHIAINKGDKKLKQSLEEGKTQAQAIRDARDEAGKVSTKAGKISSLAFGTGTAIMGGKIIKNGWKKALESPLLGTVVNTNPEVANIVAKADPIIKKHAGKIGVGLGVLSAAKGLALAKVTSKRAKNVMEKRAIKQLAEEDDKRMNNDNIKK